MSSVGTVTYTSDVLDFSDTGSFVDLSDTCADDRNRSESALKSFAASAGGQFADDSAALINDRVPGSTRSAVVRAVGVCNIGREAVFSASSRALSPISWHMKGGARSVAPAMTVSGSLASPP
jgi:hypothetical protein